MIEILELNDTNRAIAVEFMSELQEHERTLSSDRRSGQEIADAHLRYLERTCSNNAGTIFLARSQNRYCGFIVCFAQNYERDDLHIEEPLKTYGVISDLYVDPICRNQGVAKALILKAEQHLRSLGLKRIKLTVLENNTSARDAYERIGYNAHEIIYKKEL